MPQEREVTAYSPSQLRETMADVLRRRRDLEREFENAIRAFQNDTGCVVIGVSYEAIDVSTVSGVAYQPRVRLHVRF